MKKNTKFSLGSATLFAVLSIVVLFCGCGDKGGEGGILPPDDPAELKERYSELYKKYEKLKEENLILEKTLATRRTEELAKIEDLNREILDLKNNVDSLKNWRIILFGAIVFAALIGYFFGIAHVNKAKTDLEAQQAPEEK